VAILIVLVPFELGVILRSARDYAVPGRVAARRTALCGVVVETALPPGSERRS